MHRLALIGKNIAHSRSPSIYRKLIGPHIVYDLLDYSSSAEIPPLPELAKAYDGINITSPYKKHFFNDVTLTPNAKKLGAINCLKFKTGQIVGENTDYLAIVDILRKYHFNQPEMNVCLLGDGVMSRVTSYALKHLNINFDIKSRKTTESFSRLNLLGFNLIINTCAREFIFNGTISSESLFWDFNYSHHEQETAIRSLGATYVDGLELLELQAQYAVAFWSDK